VFLKEEKVVSNIKWVGMLPCLALCGCVTTSSGFHREALEANLQEKGVHINDDDVKQAAAVKPQLTFPCRVAVYLDQPAHGESWRWTAKDKELMKSWAGSLKESGVVSDVVFMSGMFAPKDVSLKELRVTAAKYGADALFVVKAAAETDSYLNPASLLYATIIGGYLIPGSHRDSLFVMQGGLVDVANGYLYATVESEGEANLIRPTFILKDKDAIDIAKKQALDSFGPELVQHVKNLSGRELAHKGGEPPVVRGASQEK
jgi:hypothetical protein